MPFIELRTTTETQKNTIDTIQVSMAMLANTLRKSGRIGHPCSKIDKFTTQLGSQFAGAQAKALAACLDKACIRVQECEGQHFPTASYRAAKKLANNLRAEIHNRPLPPAARTAAFHAGLDAVADMPPQAIKGHSNKGKPWRRHLIDALALEMMIAFREAPASVIAEIIQYADADITERAVRNVLTAERGDHIREEARAYRQQQRQAEQQGRQLLLGLSIPPKPQPDARTDAECMHEIITLAQGMQDAQLGRELVAAIHSIADLYDIR